MKRLIYCLLALCAAACAHPKVIPDEELAMIFRDAFLTNAYVVRQHVDPDSLQIYEPIFARYGYSTDDVQHTIGNFSKRKSARLSDVVERAIGLLDAEGEGYDREVAVLDTINNAASRAFTRVVHADSLIRVDRLKDTARLRYVLRGVRPGEYRVSVRYRVDSLDQNPTLRGGVWLERVGMRPSRAYTYTLRRDREERFSRVLTADSADRYLIFDFAGLPAKPGRPSITLRDLRIEYTPPASVAVDSFYRSRIDVPIFAKEFLPDAAPKDSL